jgi:hypothetical protein
MKVPTLILFLVICSAPVYRAAAAPVDDPTNPHLAPLPAALTSAPPAEAWLPRKLTEDEKAKRAAADAFMMYSTKLISDTPLNVLALQTELVNGQYDLMQSQLDDGLNKFLADPRYEFVVRDLIQFTAGSSFGRASDRYLIDEWEKQRPSSPWAHHNEALYWFRMGWDVGGGSGDWADDASDDDKKQMHKYLGYARGEILQALKLQPKNTIGWVLLLDIDRADGKPQDMKRDYESGAKQDPASFLLPLEYAYGLNPHWHEGGTYEQMDEFTQAQAAKASLNPLFWSLQGESARGKACARCNNYDWETGLKEYNLDLAYGESPSLLEDAGEAAVRLHRYALAARYFERAALYHGYEFVTNLSQLQLMQALCDPNETPLKFRALRNDAEAYGSVTIMDYPRSAGDCTYYQAELPWGDEPIPKRDLYASYSVQREMQKAANKKP